MKEERASGESGRAARLSVCSSTECATTRAMQRTPAADADERIGKQKRAATDSVYVRGTSNGEICAAAAAAADSESQRVSKCAHRRSRAAREQRSCREAQRNLKQRRKSDDDDALPHFHRGRRSAARAAHSEC